MSLSLGLAIGLASSTALSAAVPVNSVAPIISGLEYAGQTLSLIGLGTWSNSPTSYTYQWYADAVAVPGETGTTYVVDVGDVGAEITCRVTASNAGGAGSPATSNGITILSGIDVTYGASAPNYGTTFDYIVATDGNDTTGDGSVGAPYATLAKVIAVSGTAGGTVGFRAGSYTETGVDFGDAARSANLKLYPYDGEEVIWEGQDLLTGWTQCTDGVENAVGGIMEGISAGNIGNYYKKTGVTYGAGGSQPGLYSMHLHEAGVPMPLARDALSDSDITTMFLLNPDTWHTADSNLPVGVGVGDLMTDITDASVFAAYTQTQMEAAGIYYRSYGNREAWCPIASYDAGTKTATLGDQFAAAHAQPTKYVLTNIAKNMRPGEYAYVDNGDGTVDLYIYPTTPANVDTDITWAARGQFWDLGQTAGGGIEVYGMIFQGYAVDNGLYPLWNGDPPAAIVAKHNTLRRILAGPTRSGATSYGYGLMTLNACQDSTFEHNSFEDLFDHAVGNHNSDNMRFGFNHILRSERTPIRIQGAHDGWFYFNHYENSGWNTHVDKMPVYSDSDTMLFHGEKYTNCGGYWTPQRSSNIWLTFSRIGTNPTNADTRAIANQTAAWGTPVAPASKTADQFTLVNVEAPGIAGQTTGSNIQLGAPDSSGSVTGVDRAYNCAGVGIGLANATYSPDNIGDILGSTVYGDLISKSGSDVVAAHAAMYADVAAGDFTPVASGPLYRRGVDVSALLTEAEALFPGFPYFNYDIAGNYVDWADPPAAAEELGGSYTLATPTITSISVTPNGSTDFTATFDLNLSDGEYWWVVTQSATRPSDAQIIAGTDEGDAAADDSGGGVPAASGTQNVAGNNSLTAETTCYLHIVFRNVNGVTDSDTSDSFTPTAAENGQWMQWSPFSTDPVQISYGALTNAPATTTQLFCQFTYSPDAADMGSNKYIAADSPTGTSFLTILKDNVNKIQIDVKNSAGILLYRCYHATALVQDVKYGLTFSCSDANGSDLSIWNLDTGAKHGTDEVDAARDASHTIDTGSATVLKIGSTAGGTVGISGEMERFVLALEEYLDASLTATQQTLYNSGIQDLSVVIAALGATPDIAMRGTDMLSSSFTNDGDGGTPTKTGAGTITAI